MIEPTPAAPAASKRKWIGLATAGVGVIALGVGAWAGFDAKSKRDDARAAGCNDDLSECMPGVALDTANEAYSRANLSTGFVIAGTALAATGVILWLTAPSGVAPPERTSWHVVPQLAPSLAGVAFSSSF
jgi:hypothetical protein